MRSPDRTSFRPLKLRYALRREALNKVTEYQDFYRILKWLPETLAVGGMAAVAGGVGFSAANLRYEGAVLVAEGILIMSGSIPALMLKEKVSSVIDPSKVRRNIFRK